MWINHYNSKVIGVDEFEDRINLNNYMEQR